MGQRSRYMAWKVRYVWGHILYPHWTLKTRINVRLCLRGLQCVTCKEGLSAGRGINFKLSHFHALGTVVHISRAEKRRGKYPPLLPTRRWIFLLVYTTQVKKNCAKNNFICDNKMKNAPFLELLASPDARRSH